MEYYKNLSLESIFYVNDNGLVCQEEWRDIKEYLGTYQVSNLGRIKSIGRYVISISRKRFYEGKILKQTKDSDGYLYVVLSKDAKQKHFFAHRLLCIEFVLNIENKPQVNHIDSNKSNNKLDNLEWVTLSENQRHRYKSTNMFSNGIYFDKNRNKFSAIVSVKGKKIFIGRFKTENEAFSRRENYIFNMAH